MRTRSTVRMDTAEFALRLRRADTRLPAPMAAGPIANTSLEEDRVLVTPAPGEPPQWAESPLPQADKATRAAMEVISRVLDSPDFAVVIPFVTNSDDVARLAAGFIRGDEAITLLDDPHQVVAHTVAPEDLARATVTLLPTLRPYPLRPFTVTPADLTALSGLPDNFTREHVGDLARRRRLPLEDIWAFLKMSRESTARGMVGAHRYRGTHEDSSILNENSQQESGITADRFGGNWFQSPAGALAQSRTAHDGFMIEPGDTATLVRMAASSLNLLRSPSKAQGSVM